MKAWLALLALCAFGAVSAADVAPSAMAAMRWHRRVILMATPSPSDPRAIAQRHILDGWTSAAADRDISLVEVSGARVKGAADAAASLRKRYRLQPGMFQVLLIGKDGHVAMRSTQPIAAEKLQATIDAMPMRQAGEH